MRNYSEKFNFSEFDITDFQEKFDKYFVYCKQGNVKATYYYVVEGVDPECSNTYDNGKNAFAYACEENYINMLIDDF